MRILLANPRGFCAGVDRAVTIVERALKIYGKPIYVCHKVVHNRYIVETFRHQGVIIIEKITDVPDASVLIFSAHGVAQSIRLEAKRRNLNVFDATCPLVAKIHIEVARASRKGIEAGHPEVEGTLGQYNNPDGCIYLVESIKDILNLNVKNISNLCFMTQTTLSIYDTADMIKILRMRYPKIQGPRKNDICYATTNRQQAIHNIALHSNIVLVVGSKNSSTANRLAELASCFCKRVYLIDSASDLKKTWFSNIQTIGLTAGASTPEILVKEVIEYLRLVGVKYVQDIIGFQENIIFDIPKKLQFNIK